MLKKIHTSCLRCAGVRAAMLLILVVAEVGFAAGRDLYWNPVGGSKDFADINNWEVPPGANLNPPGPQDDIYFGDFNTGDCEIKNVHTVRSLNMGEGYTGAIHLVDPDVGNPETRLTIGKDEAQMYWGYLEDGTIYLEHDSVLELQGDFAISLAGTQILNGNDAGETGPGKLELTDDTEVYIDYMFTSVIDSDVVIKDNSMFACSEFAGHVDVKENEITVIEGTLFIWNFDWNAPSITAKRILLHQDGGLIDIYQTNGDTTIDAYVLAYNGDIKLESYGKTTFKDGLRLYGGDLTVELGDIEVGQGKKVEIEWDSRFKNRSETMIKIIGDVEIVGTPAQLIDTPILECSDPLTASGTQSIHIDGNVYMDFGSIIVSEKYLGMGAQTNDTISITGSLVVNQQRKGYLHYVHSGDPDENAPIGKFIFVQGQIADHLTLTNVGDPENPLVPLWFGFWNPGVAPTRFQYKIEYDP